MVNSSFVFDCEIQILPISRGGDGVSPWGQQSPEISSASWCDVVVYPPHINGGIGNSCAVRKVWDGSFYSNVNLQRQMTT